MDRAKKRCFAGSLAAHGALLLIIIFGSAFFPSRNQVEESVDSVIEMVPLTDGRATSPSPPANAAPPPVVEPRREPPAPSNPEPPVRHTQPPAKPPAPVANNEEEPAPASEQGSLPKPPVHHKPSTKESGRKPAPTKPNRELGTLVPINTAKASEASSQSKARDQARRNLAKALGDARSTIEKEASSSVEITTPGEVGATAFANYKMTIYGVYKAAFAEEALQAGEFATEDLSLTVSVTISRSGDVTESRITSRSRSAKMDRLVRRVLDKIKFIAPFPPEAKDSERNFEIQFNLKPNGKLG